MPVKPKFIVYLRVSTKKQGKSGLGLEAQREAAAKYVAARGGVVVAEYVEVESGKNTDRQKLAKAISRAKRSKATLVFAKLDRLARNAGFLLTLRDQLTAAGVSTVFCDYPNANELTIGIMAVVAQDEARAISQRTKDALAAAKARGVKLGSAREGHWEGKEHIRREAAAKGNKASAKARKEQAAEAYMDLIDVIEAKRESGLSLASIAAELNAEGYVTRRGKPFKAMTVSRVLKMAS